MYFQHVKECHFPLSCHPLSHHSSFLTSQGDSSDVSTGILLHLHLHLPFLCTKIRRVRHDPHALFFFRNTFEHLIERFYNHSTDCIAVGVVYDFKEVCLRHKHSTPNPFFVNSLHNGASALLLGDPSDTRIVLQQLRNELTEKLCLLQVITH